MVRRQEIGSGLGAELPADRFGAKRVNQTFGSRHLGAELLARNSVSELVLIDGDFVDDKNLERILNSREFDADWKTPKADVLAAAT